MIVIYVVQFLLFTLIFLVHRKLLYNSNCRRVSNKRKGAGRNDYSGMSLTSPIFQSFFENSFNLKIRCIKKYMNYPKSNRGRLSNKRVRE